MRNLGLNLKRDSSILVATPVSAILSRSQNESNSDFIYYQLGLVD